MKYKLTIMEYGKEIRSYSDNDKIRFLEKSQEIVIEHMRKYSHQSNLDIKNVQIHYATYE